MIAALEWIVLTLAAIMVVSSVFFVRRRAPGPGVQNATLTFCALFTIATVVIPLIGWSPFHLLWIYPASFIVATLSNLPPLRFLWSLGKTYGRLCCL